MIELSRRDGRPLRIGHRGAAALAPENSLEAVGLAVELGCDLVEFDVHAVGQALVVAHDRPAAADGLPALDEVLALLGEAGTGVHLDLKAQGADGRSPRRCGGTGSSSGRSSARSARRRCGRCTRPSRGCGWADVPAGPHRPDQAGGLPSACAGDRACPAPDAPAPDRGHARGLTRNGGRALLGGGHGGGRGALPRARGAGARLDGGRRASCCPGSTGSASTA